MTKICIKLNTTAEIDPSLLLFNYVGLLRNKKEIISGQEWLELTVEEQKQYELTNDTDEISLVIDKIQNGGWTSLETSIYKQQV